MDALKFLLWTNDLHQGRIYGGGGGGGGEGEGGTPIPPLGLIVS